ncbi:MAG: four helix bundle protein [Candidatus Poribacteria bacterium]
MNREEFKKELEERLLNFAVAMVKMSSELPKTPAAFEIGKQIVDSGCSPNASYAEAKFAVSLADFTHIMRVCRKELNESFSWMKVIVKARLLSWERVKPDYEECNELISIFTSSIKKLEKRIDRR